MAQLAGLLDRLPIERQAPPVAAILQEAASRMQEFGVQRMEYPILALHVLTVAWATEP